MGRCRNYILNYLWNIKIYSESSKVFQNKCEIVILSHNNKVLCNIKSLESNRVSFEFLSEDVFCEIGNGTIYFSETNLMGMVSEEECILACHDVTSLDLKRARSLIASGLNICEECLGKSLEINLEKQLLLISELLIEDDIGKEEKICDLCGDNRDCICEVVEERIKADEEPIQEEKNSTNSDLEEEIELDKKE